MSRKYFEDWDTAECALAVGVREFAVQIGKTPRGFLLARTITPYAILDQRG